MELRKQLITPEIAKKLLEKNTSNRRINKPTLLRYIQDIQDGRWREDTAEFIKISVDGNVLDGQHRLMAVAQSMIPVFFHVAYGLEDNLFSIIDTGKPRSTSDTFRIAGIKNDCQVSAIMTNYNAVKKYGFNGVQKNHKHTNAMLMDQYHENPEHWHYVQRNANSWYESFAKILSTSTIGGFFALFYEINKEDAVNFMTQLCTGEGITNKTIHLLRKRLIQEKIAIKKSGPLAKNSLIVKTWNHFRKGDQMQCLKFDAEREGYPKPI